MPEICNKVNPEASVSLAKLYIHNSSIKSEFSINKGECFGVYVSMPSLSQTISELVSIDKQWQRTEHCLPLCLLLTRAKIF